MMETKKTEVGIPVRRALLPTLRSIDEKKRTITFVASDESVDRYGDVIRASGWQYQNYLKNPVFLWGHRSGDPPIGKCVDLKIESNPPALVQTIEFASKDVYPFAETVFNLYRGGFLKAVSVGFMPIVSPAPMKDEEGHLTGYEFNGQELLELSAVPIPANRNALARAMNTGNITEEEIKKFFSFGERNPAWAYLAPGVTIPEEESKAQKENEVKSEDEKKIMGRQEPVEPLEPPEDEPAGSAADNAEELGEALDEIASEVAGAQKLLAVLVSQLEPGASEENDSARPAVSKQKSVPVSDGTLSDQPSDVIETRIQIDNLAGAGTCLPNANDVTARITELCSMVERQSIAISALAEAAATKTEITEMITKFDAQIAKVDSVCTKVESLVWAFEELSKLAKEQAEKFISEEKTVVPYVDDPIAPKDTPWDASAELAKQAKPEGWKRMSTVIVGDPKLKGSYKLAHHSGSGFKVIPNGVRAALGRFEQTQMASADRAGARAHLVKHEKKIQAESGIDFDDSAFEAKLMQLGEAYRAAEAAGLTAFVESVNREIEAHIATLDSTHKPEKISTTEDLLARLFSKP